MKKEGVDNYHNGNPFKSDFNLKSSLIDLRQVF
jgi:hypothetical protein